MASQFCQYCGAGMDPDSTFCQACGKAQAAPEQPGPAPAAAYTPPQQQYNTTTPQYNPNVAYNSSVQGNLDAPLKVGEYIGMMLLMCIPIVRFIMVLVWGFGSTSNTNKKNFARAIMILFVIMIAVSIVIGILFGAILMPLIQEYIDEVGSGGMY
ncbi:MAG: zinc ribbon domain-containing protein [Saccharofermentanales bacterium]